MARAVTTAVAIRMARAHASGVLPLPFEELRESPHSRASPLEPPYRFSCVLTRPVISCNRAQVSASRYLRRNGVPYSENAVVTEIPRSRHRVRQRLPDRGAPRWTIRATSISRSSPARTSSASRMRRSSRRAVRVEADL